MVEPIYVSLSYQQLKTIQKNYENCMIPIDRVYYVADNCPVSEKVLRRVRKLMIKFIKMYFNGEIDINNEIYLEKGKLRIIKSQYTSHIYGKNKDTKMTLNNVVFQYRDSIGYQNLIILLG